MKIIEYYTISQDDDFLKSKIFYNEKGEPFYFCDIQTIKNIFISKKIKDWNEIFEKNKITKKLENNLTRDIIFILTDITFEEKNNFFIILFNGIEQTIDYYIKRYNKEFNEETYYRDEKIIQFIEEKSQERKIYFIKNKIKIFEKEDI